MLRISLEPEDLGRVRFAAAPAPVLETVLMLFELRNRPHEPGTGRGDWRTLVRSAFPAASRPLLNLVPARQFALYLDVLTTGAQEAFEIVRETTDTLHADNLARIEQLCAAPVPIWLRRYSEGDREVLDALDRALRSFHGSILEGRWSGVTNCFHGDVAYRAATMLDHGVSAMLNTLHPDLVFRGLELESPYPWERCVRLGGKGLILMPSAFWTGHPLFTWDPLNSSNHVLIYPARPSFADYGAAGSPGAARELEFGPRLPIEGRHAPTGDSLAALLGPTRAAVLDVLRQPNSTTGIARHIGISVSSASEHVTRLRDARLVISRRRGQAVEHRLTRLGYSLLAPSGADRAAGAVNPDGLPILKDSA